MLITKILQYMGWKCLYEIIDSDIFVSSHSKIILKLTISLRLGTFFYSSFDTVLIILMTFLNSDILEI